MTAALFSFFGIIAGAMLQYFFGRHLEHQRHNRELRTKAYTDYLKCVSEKANLQLMSHEVRELSAKTADAKCRICLYGDRSVIEAFAAFERLGATMNSPDQRAAFARMVELMRNNSTGGGSVALGDLQVLLLGVGGDAT